MKKFFIGLAICGLSAFLLLGGLSGPSIFDQYDREVGWYDYQVTHTWNQSKGNLKKGYIHQSRLDCAYEMNNTTYYFINDPDGWSWLRNSPGGDKIAKVFSEILVAENFNADSRWLSSGDTRSSSAVDEQQDWVLVTAPIGGWQTQRHTSTWTTRSGPNEWHIIETGDCGEAFPLGVKPGFLGHPTANFSTWRGVDNFPVPEMGYKIVSEKWANIDDFDIITNREYELEYVTGFSDGIKSFFQGDDAIAMIAVLLWTLAGIGYIIRGVYELQSARALKKEEELEVKRRQELKLKKEKKEKERTKLAQENNLRGNIKSRFVKGNLKIEEAIKQQISLDNRIAEEKALMEKRKAEEKALMEKRTKELDKHKINDEKLRNLYLKGSLELDTVKKSQQKLNMEAENIKKMRKVIKKYNLSTSQEYLLFKLLGSSSLKNAEEKALVSICKKLVKWGVEMCNKIKSGSAKQGMTKEQLILCMGRAGKEDETVYKNTTKTKRYYYPYKTRQNKLRYKLRVDLEDGVVVGWKEGKF